MQITMTRGGAIAIGQGGEALMRVLRLEPLTVAGLPAVLELDRVSLGNLWSADGYLREIESPNSDLLILQGIPPEGDTIVALGCAWSILEESHITILAVRPELQRQGLGQAMLVALLQAAHQRHLERATLEVRVSNESAIALYQKFGFREAGRRKQYYQDTGEDALVMWRGGIHHPDFPELLQQWQTAARDRLRQWGWQIEGWDMEDAQR